MDIFEDFLQMRAELKEILIDYYEVNLSWIKAAHLHQGQQWTEVINGEKKVKYCPNSTMIIGIVTSLDKRLAGYIKIAAQVSCSYDIDTFVRGLKLRFDPDAALEERAERNKEVQEAKLLSGSDEEDDLGLDILRKEASQLINKE